MAEICGLDIPPEIDSPVTVEVDATSASEEGFISAVARYSGGTTEVEIEEPEPRKFTLVLKPPRPDKYTLDVRWGQNHVYGSPLDLDLRPPNAKAITVAEPPGGKLQAGQPIEMCFDTSNAGRGEMLCTCIGEVVGEISVDVQRRDSTNKFDINFQPPREDKYTLTVKWAGRSIKGSPFLFNLFHTDASKVKVLDIKLSTNPDDPIYEMNISTKGAGDGRLRARCAGLIYGSLPLNIEEIARHEYCISLRPPKDDTVIIDVYFEDIPIPGSPFYALPANAQGNC